jgi:hypothetical protein
MAFENDDEILYLRSKMGTDTGCGFHQALRHDYVWHKADSLKGSHGLQGIKTVHEKLCNFGQDLFRSSHDLIFPDSVICGEVRSVYRLCGVLAGLHE